MTTPPLLPLVADLGDEGSVFPIYVRKIASFRLIEKQNGRLRQGIIFVARLIFFPLQAIAAQFRFPLRA